MAWVEPTLSNGGSGSYRWDNHDHAIDGNDRTFADTKFSIPKSKWSQFLTMQRASGAIDRVRFKLQSGGVGNDGTIDIEYHNGAWHSLYYGTVFDEDGGWTTKWIPAGCTSSITHVRIRWGGTHGSSRKPKIYRFQWNTCTPPPTADIKTVNDVALASIKTINDVAIASVKTVNEKTTS
jgi:hypothetical protein